MTVTANIKNINTGNTSWRPVLKSQYLHTSNMKETAAGNSLTVCCAAEANVHRYAIVVPCCNEETRFPFAAFLSFAQRYRDVLLCFVNNGSGDNTEALLLGLQAECPQNIHVLSLQQNSGKPEAVRQGMLHAEKNSGAGLIGFLDADLATNCEEWLDMAIYQEQHGRYGAIVGSRIRRLGASVNRHNNRCLFSGIIKACIRLILKAPFQDIWCGAKIFHRSLVPFLFSSSFKTPQLFDVEIFLRLQQKFGKTTLQKGVLEYPLMHWPEAGGSKLKHCIKIPFQLGMLCYRYHIAPASGRKRMHHKWGRQARQIV